MSIQKEIEFKNLLEKEEFDTLCSEFGVLEEDFHIQTNTYFDTKDFQLRDAFMGFRLRVLEQRNELTLKAPGENQHTMIETTRLITEFERDEILQNGCIKPQAFDEFLSLPEVLFSFGSLRTCRVEIPYQKGVLVLDRSDYLGETDYEVEFEVTDYENGRQSFNTMLSTHRIPVRPTPKKIARFMKAAQHK
ncbi:CYTH domain-containing protein [Paenisporosarcina quisquiliarum]|uniref:CYTH domain-containing protein n=1 Tax=Paenisporosarcina quisquiliarum TaxID=365346 RepID=A0A9X3LHK2_9BACL|nr:CYTH domain-containing protein [Paenisporosarcina quisquiliarum]MCZ8536559.1 CYTH domain-containing protein [Paenisporosarcina quisquiliarum]